MVSLRSSSPRTWLLACATALSTAFLCVAGGCQTNKSVPMGLQPEFAALNPSRILAVPLFVLPNPARPSEIDVAILETENTRKVIEQSVLGAFRNQPGVNGVSFQAVRQALGTSPNALTRMNEAMRGTAARLTSTKESERLTLTRECLARKTFLDFYVHCLSKEKAWTDELNALSARILNADTALLTIVTELVKRDTPQGLLLEAEVAVVMVDTNSGKLIWGRQDSESLSKATESGSRAVPEGAELFPRLLSEPFWADFPGRRLPTP